MEAGKGQVLWSDRRRHVRRRDIEKRTREREKREIREKRDLGIARNETLKI